MNEHNDPEPDFIADLTTTSDQRGRSAAEAQALRNFSIEFNNIPDIDVTNDQMDRMLLRVFECGCKFALHAAGTLENLDSLVMEPGQEARTPSPKEALSVHSAKHFLERRQEVALLTSFIENQGLTEVFFAFLNLVDQERLRAVM